MRTLYCHTAPMTISQQSVVDALRSSSKSDSGAATSRWPRQRRCSFATLVREYSTVRRAERVLGCNGNNGRSGPKPASRHDFSFTRGGGQFRHTPCLSVRMSRQKWYSGKEDRGGGGLWRPKSRRGARYRVSRILNGLRAHASTLTSSPPSRNCSHSGRC